MATAIQSTENLDWGLDPLFWTNAKLFIADIYKAKPTHIPGKQYNKYNPRCAI